MKSTSVNRVVLLSWFCAFFLILKLSAAAAESSDIRDSFFVSPLELPKGLVTPEKGVIVNAENIPRYSFAFDDDIAELIALGKISIEVGETTQFPISAAYLEATEKYSESVTLGDQPGVINNYIAGRPFPIIDINDDRAGEKAAWNMRFAYAPDETEVTDFHWQYRNMRTAKVERNIEMYARMLRFKHRLSKSRGRDLPKNPAGIFNAMYLQVKKPTDIRNTQLLIHRLEDDTQVEQVWLYTNTQRRVRRLAASQTTDAFLGSDIMIEDFLGYNGRIMDMNWQYHGERWLMLPLYNHNKTTVEERYSHTGIEDVLVYGHKPVEFHGQGNCFPNVSWQLRKVYVVKASPKELDHPVSSRTFYLDAQGFAPPLVKIYDRAGKLWKMGIIGVTDSRYQMAENINWEGGITESVSMIDLQADHCTTIQLSPKLPKAKLAENGFSVQYLRSSGR